MKDAGTVSVAILPFWRYAVRLKGRPDIPAIPFFQRASAEQFYSESAHALPWATTQLLRRTRRGVVVVRSTEGANDDL